jgi:hypothetical protein
MNTASRKEDLYELLPWHENGTLGDADNDAVRALLASDLEANRQARELRVLRGAVADEPIMATNMAMSLRRLHARLDPPAPRRSRWFMPLSFAAAALLLVAAGLGIFRAGQRAGQYVTLTSNESPAVPADSVLYRVNVVAGVDAEQLAQLAQAPGVRVLQGPSERGVALIAVPGAEAESVAARLSSDPHLRFVAMVPR